MSVRPWCPLALALALAVPASAQVLPAAPTGSPLRPLIRLAGWESGCTREDAPDSCRQLLRDRLVEVFRDGRATGVSTTLSEGVALSRTANGAIVPEALATLSATIAEAQLGASVGSCDPYPESASFPSAARYDLLWFGRSGRYNLVVLARGEAPCPDAVADVFNQLLVIADVGIVPGS